MSDSGAKLYLNPEMMEKWEELFDNVHDLAPKEAEYLDVHTKDKIKTLEYKILQLPHDMATRADGPERNMPYLTRAGFALSFGYCFMQSPVSSAFSDLEVRYKKLTAMQDTCHTQINKILLNKSLMIHDPYTDEPFKHNIPRRTYDNDVSPEIKAMFVKANQVYLEKRAEILAERQTAGIIEEKERNERARTGDFATMAMNQSTQNSTNMMLNAAQNTQMMAAASAFAHAQAQNAWATRNAMAIQSKL
jgi:hypothetical protein